MSWLLGWKFRKKITIQDAYVDGNLANFPAYIFINADADFHEARADGHDIRFTLSDGTTLLKYECEYWTGGNGSPATAHFWVKVPSILASGGATIYIYYGKSDAPDGQDAPNVWDANFKGIWHLKDITPSTVADSTGVNNGTKVAANEPIEVDGKIYKAQESDGLNDQIIVQDSDSLDIVRSFSISIWIKDLSIGSLSVNTHPVFKYKYSTKPYYGLHAPYGTRRMGVMIKGAAGGYYTPSYSLPDNNLHHVMGSYDYDLHKLFLYVDTVLTREKDVPVGFEIGPNTGTLKMPHGQGRPYFMDEIRHSNVARTFAWLKFENHNINETDNELTWGIEEGILYSERLMDAYLEKKINLSGSLEEKLNISGKTEERRGIIT